MRIGELDADALVVGAAVVERVVAGAARSWRRRRPASASPTCPAPPSAPISLAYSGSIWPGRCRAPAAWRCARAPTNSGEDQQRDAAPRAGRASSACDGHPRSGCALDGEALDVVLGLGGIERPCPSPRSLAGRRSGGVRPTSFISLAVSVARNTCCGDLGVVDVALDLPPALHLGQDPDRERLPRERDRSRCGWASFFTLPRPSA